MKANGRILLAELGGDLDGDAFGVTVEYMHEVPCANI